MSAMGSDSALHLVGAETSGTDVDMARSTVDDRLDTLDIGLPHSVGTSVGVGHLDAERHTLAANIALCHWLHLPSVVKVKEICARGGIGCYNIRYSRELQAKNKIILKIFPCGLKPGAFSNIMVLPTKR